MNEIVSQIIEDAVDAACPVFSELSLATSLSEAAHIHAAWIVSSSPEFYDHIEKTTGQTQLQRSRRSFAVAAREFRSSLL